MGLGKTLTTIAYIMSLPQEKGYRSALVMVPKSLLKNWNSECTQSLWSGAVSWVIVHGSNPGSFNLSLEELHQHNIVLTTPNAVYKQQKEYEAVKKNMLEDGTFWMDLEIPHNGWPLLKIKRKETFPGWEMHKPWHMYTFHTAQLY